VGIVSDIFSGKWGVNTKIGRPQDSVIHVEVCITREDNAHGIASYGWFGPDKCVVFTGDINLGAWVQLKPYILQHAEAMASLFNADQIDEIAKRRTK
jgi:hypothetical protein